MITVLVADDHKLVRESLQRILDAEPDIKCVGVASDGAEAIELTKRLSPNVVIVDINMPGMNGIEVTLRIKTDCPQIAVLVLTAYDYEEYLVACLEAGADGFVLKAKLACDELANAVRMVHAGPSVFDHEAIASLRNLMKRTPADIPANPAKLCDREMEILSLASKGMTSKQIASALGISNFTVNTHFTNIFKKLDAHSRVEAVVIAMQHGLVPRVEV